MAIAGGGGDARGALGTIKDWVQAQIAQALRTHIGRTWLFVNGVGVAARHKIDVQMTGATGEDHPELDLVRAILPDAGGGGSSAIGLLASVTIATASESLIRLPATGSFDQSYKNMELRAQIAADFDDGSGDAARLFLRFNSSTISYNSTLHEYDRPTIGAVHTTEGGPAGTEALIGRVAPRGFADEASTLVAHINNYSGSVWRKHILSRCSTLWVSASDCFEYQGTAVWRQTDPVDYIELWTDGVMLEGSTFQVYGLSG